MGFTVILLVQEILQDVSAEHLAQVIGDINQDVTKIQTELK